MDLASALSRGSEAQALAGLSGALSRKALPPSLEDPDEWGGASEPGLPRAILVSGMEALTPEGARKAFAWGERAASAGAAPIFLAAGSIDCDPPAGFARVSDGKSRSLLGMAAREARAPEGLSLEELAEEPSEAEREEPLEEARRAAPRRRG